MGVMPTKTDRLETEELQVGRHVKMLSDVGRFDVHCSASTMGAWLQPIGKKGNDGQVGMHIQNGVAFFSIWPSAEAKYPFAISANGLQVVKDDGTVRIMPLGKIAELVDQLMSVEDKPNSPVTEQVIDRVRKSEEQRRQCNRGCVNATTGDDQPTSRGCESRDVVQGGQHRAKTFKNSMDVRPVDDVYGRATGLKDVTLVMSRLMPGQVNRLREFVRSLTNDTLQESRTEDATGNKPYMG